MSSGSHGRCAICGGKLKRFYMRHPDGRIERTVLLCSTNPKHREEAVKA